MNAARHLMLEGMLVVQAPGLVDRSLQPFMARMVTAAESITGGCAMADQLHVQTQVCSAAAATYRQGVARGRGDEDVFAVLKMLIADRDHR